MSYLARFLAKRGVLSSVLAGPTGRVSGDAPSENTRKVRPAETAKSLSSVLAGQNPRASEAGMTPASVHAASTDKTDESVAVKEVLGLRADWLVDLPIPPVLELAVRGLGDGVLVDLTPRPQPGRFCASEWLALSSAASAERARGRDMETWARCKRERPQWRLPPLEAMGGHIYADLDVWSVGRVLEQLDTVLVAVHVEEATATLEMPLMVEFA